MTYKYFTKDDLMIAWNRAKGTCEGCGKVLDSEKFAESESGGWNAHEGDDGTPILLCCDGVSSCYPYFVKFDRKYYPLKNIG